MCAGPLQRQEPEASPWSDSSPLTVWSVCVLSVLASGLHSAPARARSSSERMLCVEFGVWTRALTGKARFHGSSLPALWLAGNPAR